ncbi:TFPI2 [Cordylochernes scorpioides]|uniref:TFPI2 n=1 Tax=Cordylochernes scorpioides TaxID=51811 RepID=A0ABY6L011_9ARAC|nr:TFPI2 [Cordylochernes scorpioides]
MPSDPEACDSGGGFYFDTDNLTCQPFPCGQCGTGGNNFETLEACRDECAGTVPPPPPTLVFPTSTSLVVGAAFIRPDYCLDSPAPGSCQATLPRYFYNATTGTCQTFLYSGCDCSRNNFRGLDDCLDVCKGKVHLLVPIGPGAT